MLELRLTAETPTELRVLLFSLTDMLPELGAAPTPIDPGADKIETAAEIAARHDALSGPVIPAAAPPVVGGTEPAAIPDSALPWDARINTANKAKKNDGTWKRKPGLTDEVYNGVLAELRAAAPAAPPAAAAGPALAAVVPGAPDMSVLMEKTAALVNALGVHGPTALTSILTHYGAVGPSPDGGVTPGPVALAALQLPYYPQFVATADLIIANAAQIAANPAMIQTLIQ